MIEILGIKLSYEAIVFLLAFAASEYIGESKLKESSVFGLIKRLIDSLKGLRTEDEKVEEIKGKIDELVEEIRSVGE